jgi:hypothetical protein
MLICEKGVVMTCSLFIRNVSAAIVFTLLAAPSVAFAQAQGTKFPVANKQVVSASPFLLMAEYLNVEFERKASDTGTFGLSASSVGIGDADYRNVQAFYRYYPQGASLTGFYIGGRGGLHRISDDEDSGKALGLGFEIGYGWLFGSKRNFAVSVGAGATRLFGGDMDGHSLTIPTLRLVNIGWSF